MSERTSDHQILSWTDYRGQEQKRTVRMTLDIRDFLGMPGYSLLLVAANANAGLSVSEILMYLGLVAEEYPRAARTANWVQKRRWMFQPPDTDNLRNGRANKDGMQDRAFALIERHPELSLRNLRVLLCEHGIDRSTEWIRRNRGATTTTVRHR